MLKNIKKGNADQALVERRQSIKGEEVMRIKVKIAADARTAGALRHLIAKVNESGMELTDEDVQVCAWLMEVAREINVASAARLQLAGFDRGHEMVLER